MSDITYDDTDYNEEESKYDPFVEFEDNGYDDPSVFEDVEELPDGHIGPFEIIDDDKSEKSATKSASKNPRFCDENGVIIPEKSKFRNFIFTWNNYPTDYQQRLELLNCKFLIAGKEVAPKTGTPHLQGYMQFKEQLRISELAKRVWTWTTDNYNTGMPVESRDRGSGISKFAPAKFGPDHNIAYCSKEDPEPFEYGEASGRGKRNDLKVIKKMCEEGKNMNEILESCTSYQSIKTAEKLLEYKDKPRSPQDGEMKVIWIYGETRTGKTFGALKEYPNAYIKGNNMGKWYQGYDGEKEMILDEFRSSTMKYSELLGLLQPIPYRVEVKGGGRQMRAMTIIITSCFSPAEIYPNVDENRDQLYRRITELRYYKTQRSHQVLHLDNEMSTKKRCQLIRMFSEKYQVDHEVHSDSDDSNISLSDYVHREE